MWQGFRHGVHYLDHVKLLTPKLIDISGGAFTVFDFKNDRKWSLSFELHLTGDMHTEGDGFLMSLSSLPLPNFNFNFSDSEFKITDENFKDALSKVG